jgi:hypothetical protein
MRGSIRGEGYASIFNTGEPNEFWVRIDIDKDYPKREDQYLDLSALKKVIIALQNDEKAASDLDKSPYKQFTYGRLGLYVRRGMNGLTQFRGKYYKGMGGEFSEYTWEQLAQGAAEKGASEYLMVGSGITPLNIINQTPLNGILWEDFMTRLRGGPKPKDAPPDEDR